jgi:hypothetical protein
MTYSRFKAVLLEERDKSYKIRQGDRAPVFIPKSQVKHILKGPAGKRGERDISAEAPDWLLDEKDILADA